MILALPTHGVTENQILTCKMHTQNLNSYPELTDCLEVITQCSSLWEESRHNCCWKLSEKLFCVYLWLEEMSAGNMWHTWCRLGGRSVLPRWRTFKIHPLISSHTGTTHSDLLTILFPSLVFLGPPPNFIPSKSHHCCPSVHSCGAISRSTGALTGATSFKKLTVPIPEAPCLQKLLS